MTKKISMPEREYRRHKRNTERIEKLKPLIQKANKLLMNTKIKQSNDL